jgi:hypothetical protein
MQPNTLQQDITSTKIQLEQQEKLFDEAMKHDKEFGLVKKIYQNIKSLRLRLNELRQPKKSNSANS